MDYNFEFISHSATFQDHEKIWSIKKSTRGIVLFCMVSSYISYDYYYPQQEIAPRRVRNLWLWLSQWWTFVKRWCIEIYISILRWINGCALLALSSWWRHQTETFSVLLALCVGNLLDTGDSPSQRPVTRGFDVFFDLRLNKRFNKQPGGWWFETPSCSVWRHCNVGNKGQLSENICMTNATMSRSNRRAAFYFVNIQFECLNLSGAIMSLLPAECDNHMHQWFLMMLGGR